MKIKKQNLIILIFIVALVASIMACLFFIKSMGKDEAVEQTEQTTEQQEQTTEQQEVSDVESDPNAQYDDDTVGEVVDGPKPSEVNLADLHIVPNGERYYFTPSNGDTMIYSNSSAESLEAPTDWYCIISANEEFIAQEVALSAEPTTKFTAEVLGTSSEVCVVDAGDVIDMIAKVGDTGIVSVRTTTKDKAQAKKNFQDAMDVTFTRQSE